MRKTFQTFLVLLIVFIGVLLGLMMLNDRSPVPPSDSSAHELVWFSYRYADNKDLQMIIAERMESGDERLMVLYGDDTEGMFEGETEVLSQVEEILRMNGLIELAGVRRGTSPSRSNGDEFLYYLDNEEGDHISEADSPEVFEAIRAVLANAIP